MSSTLLHCLVLVSGISCDAPAVVNDSIPMYRSPVVHPELQPGILVLSPVFDTSTVRVLPQEEEVDTFVRNLLEIQKLQQARLLEYYEQEHLRLDGMLRAKNTDAKIQFNSYSSKASRSGEKDIGLSWLIEGHTSTRSIGERKRHLQSVFTAAIAVLEWYAEVHQRTINWSDIKFILSVDDELKVSISEAAFLPYLVMINEKEEKAEYAFAFSIQGPAFFQRAYHEYLNESAKVERETRRRINQHR